MDLCRACGKPMTVAEEGFLYHSLCIPEFTAVPGMGGMSMYDLEIREDVIEVVRWANANSKRSQQIELGCSEVGHPCDRRIAYRIAGVGATGYSNDCWPAVVGTSVHAWMEGAVHKFQEAHGLSHWVTEMQVFPNPLVKGHTDLYDAKRQLVLDWKFPGPENMRAMRKDGVSQQYQIQTQLYAMGHVAAGRPVRRVGIVALGRSGWLKDMFVWTTEYDPGVAQAAIDRVYSIGSQLLDSDLDDPRTWENVAAQPSRLCSWCPWHRQAMSSASKQGCPGRRTDNDTSNLSH